MHRSNHMHNFWDAFDPIASALSTFRGTALIFSSDPIAAKHILLFGAIVRAVPWSGHRI